jgi:chemotaxis protein MotB
MAKGKKGEGGTTIIKREEVVEGGHHGGAWKVAYADFVTAMMAFFLLMWLLNATTEQQRRGLADYFSPSNVLGQAATGSGQPFGGHTPNDDGSMVSDKGARTAQPGQVAIPPEPSDADTLGSQAPTESTDDTGKTKPSDTDGNGAKGGGGQANTAAAAPAQADYLGQAASGSATKVDPRATDPAHLADKALRAEIDRRERAAFDAAASAIRDAVAADPALADLGRQLRIDVTPEGLRIQLLDAENTPMFASGSADLDERARALLVKVAGVLAKLPEPIAITGHTDAAPYKGGDRTNWELSSERANATRRLLTEAGLPEARFASVSGRADRDPLLPADPMAAANRRIAIVVQRIAAARR